MLCGSSFTAKLKVFGDVRSAKLYLCQRIKECPYEACVLILKAGKKREEVVKRVDVFRDRIILLAFKGDGMPVLSDFEKLPNGIVVGYMSEDAELRLEIKASRIGRAVVESATMQRI